MRGGDRTSTVAGFPAVPASGTSRNLSKFQSIHDKHFDSQMWPELAALQSAVVNSEQVTQKQSLVQPAAQTSKSRAGFALFPCLNICKLPPSAIRRTNNAAVFLSRNHKTLNITFKANRLSSHSAGQLRWSRLCATAHINNTMVHSIVPSPPPPLPTSCRLLSANYCVYACLRHAFQEYRLSGGNYAKNR